MSRHCTKGKSGTYTAEFRHCTKRGVQEHIKKEIRHCDKGGVQEHIKKEIRHCDKGGVQEHIKRDSGTVPRGEFRNI